MYEKDSHHRGSAIIRYGNGRNYPTKQPRQRCNNVLD